MNQTRRIWIYFVLGLALFGCTAPQVSSGGLPAPTLPSPSAVPTAQAAPPRLFFSLAYDSPQPLHGTPPFTANLTARFYGDAPSLRGCQNIRWQFGDGIEETQPCLLIGDPPYYFEITHTYQQPGTFHASAWLAFDDGRTVQAEKTQTVIVAVPQPIPPIESIIFWGAWSATIFTATVACIWLHRKSRRAKIIGYAVIALGLISFVPPFSYVPNPAGIVWAILGNYTYDPRLPFVNRFIIAGDPTAQLCPLLDGLIGQTGLDPLDPVQPLARYEFVQVRYPARYGATQVRTRLTYADGSQRTYAIPLYQTINIFGFSQANWRYDGLGRLRTEHRELPGTPFANASSSIRFGTPQVLNFDAQAQMLDADNFANWGLAGVPSQKLVWSPQGDAFLATQTLNDDQHALWLVHLDRPPVRLADNVRDYTWSPDGRFIIATDYWDARRVQIISRYSLQARITTRDPSLALPGVDRDGVWYASQNELWLASYDNDAVHRLAPLPDLKSSAQEWVIEEIVIRPSPDGKRVAYSCEGKLCLQDRDGSNRIRTSLSLREATWNSNGTHLATVGWDSTSRGQVVLSLVRRDGVIEKQIAIAPDGVAAPPQWTSSGKRIFVQTFPFGGRRILTIDVATGQILDLSQPRWDAWFALAPDDHKVLLTNGRGGFWLSEIVVK